MAGARLASTGTPGQGETGINPPADVEVVVEEEEEEGV